jgi:hypothetical protein
MAMLMCAVPEDATTPPPDDTFDGYTDKRHFELTMGFTGGVRETAAFEPAAVYGLAWDTRYVTRHVRFTVGLQKPFVSHRAMDVNLWDVRFGLGTEYAFKYAAPFVDVLGDVQRVDVRWTFGFVVRAGVRVHMGEWLFLQPAGEVGLGGPVGWAVGLQAGWVFPVG